LSEIYFKMNQSSKPDLRDFEEKIKNYVAYDESLYDLMCSLTGFDLQTENEGFNNAMLNGGLSQGNAIEIVYSSNNEKNSFLYYLLTELLYTNYLNANDGVLGVEILFFDNYANFDLLALHEMLLAKIAKVEEGVNKQEIINNLMKKLLIYRPLDKKDFILNLKSFWNLLHTNKFIRVVIIDSINSFQFFDDYYKSEGGLGKEKRRHATAASKKNFYKELNTRIHEHIQKIVTKEKLCSILFKREYFKMADCVAWDETKSKFCLSTRLASHLNNRIFPTRKIVLINFENINDATLDIINKIASKQATLERLPNLNMAIVKNTNEETNLLLMTYNFGNLTFQLLNHFQMGNDDYYYAAKPEYHHHS